MKSVIMAGGLGTRLRPLTNVVPKHALPVFGKPMIEYVIESMVSGGFNDIILTTGHIYDKIVEVVGDATQYGAKAVYSIESRPLGTAGSVKRVQAFLDDTFVVGSGDVLADVDIKELYKFHKKKGAIATMALTEVENPTEYGIVGLDDDGKIVKFKEKPLEYEVFSNLINAGIYVLEPEALNYVPEETMFDFSKNLFPVLLEKGVLYGKPIKGLWRDVGRPADLIGAHIDVGERKGSVLKGYHEGANIDGVCYIAESAVVEEGATVVNSFIYGGAVVKRGAYVENSIVFDGSVVEENVVLKNSIVFWNTFLNPDETYEYQIITPPGVGE